jgi:hypothetical protein
VLQHIGNSLVISMFSLLLDFVEVVNIATALRIASLFGYTVQNIILVCIKTILSCLRKFL